MAEFASSGVTNATPNLLANIPAALAANQELQANALGIDAKQMANQYTEATQPAQINQLLGAFRAYNDASQEAAQQPTALPPAAPAMSPSMRTAPSPMLSGPTPISADPDSQNSAGAAFGAAGLNPVWGMRIQHAESGGIPPQQIASITSPAGAVGPMQIMSDTAKGLGIDPTVPQQNFEGAAKYMAQLKQQFGSPVLATAAYNAGPQRVNDWLSGKGALPTETVNYLSKVSGGDGMALLNDALAGYHGSIPGHDSDMGAGMYKPVGTGLEQDADDPTARATTRQLLAMQRMALAMPGGQGMRAVAQIQSSLDNIAGPGGIIAPDGSVHRVPGSFATRYAASQATKSGETAPMAQQAADKASIEAGANQAMHAANADVDLKKDLNTPKVMDPGARLIVPSSVLPQGDTAPISAPAYQDPLAATRPEVPQQSAITPAAPQSAQSQGYVAPGNPAIQEAASEGNRLTAMQDPIMQAASDAQRQLNVVAQVRAAMKNASAAGLPAGKFAEPFAESLAAAKYLGIDPKAVGVDPTAVQNQQVANEGLTQLNMQVLKRLFPGGRITDTDVRTIGSKLASYNLDPTSLDAVLNTVEKPAQYDVNKANDMLDYKDKNGTLKGWEPQFYKKNGYNANLIDTALSGTVPAGAMTMPPPAAVAHLKANPGLAGAFDQKYGNGASKAALSQ